MRIVIYILSAWFIGSCASMKSELKQELKNIDLVQGSQIWKLSPGSHALQISNRSFAMVFLQKAYNEEKDIFHTVQVNATQNIDLYNSIEVGHLLEEIECFSPGSGLAMSNGNNPELMLVDYGHHYLYYANEQDRRLSKLGAKKEYNYLEWKLDALSNNPDVVRDENGDILLYLTVVIDRDKDKQIDEDELWKIELISRD